MKKAIEFTDILTDMVCSKKILPPPPPPILAAFITGKSMRIDKLMMGKKEYICIHYRGSEIIIK